MAAAAAAGMKPDRGGEGSCRPEGPSSSWCITRAHIRSMRSPLRACLQSSGIRAIAFSPVLAAYHPVAPPGQGSNGRTA
ncbi:hypothetical protein E2C01_077969 [Portunus trituberculatus]|uniref:Uncharacterized protein n=1 Tax=Portunus trituberculatus TaxID=210409 RepID=A0A5B7ISV7_PORTR|nr:hypothetical protein [Portunus trituberculatus]